MNDKTAKLIRKYATHKEEDLNALRRRWTVMNQEERRRFRQRMKSALVSKES